jgi:hypothetical protein
VLPELAAELLETRGFVHSPTNDGEIQPALGANVPVVDFSEMKDDVDVNVWPPASYSSLVQYSVRFQHLSSRREGGKARGLRGRAIHRKDSKDAIAHKLEDFAGMLFNILPYQLKVLIEECHYLNRLIDFV